MRDVIKEKRDDNLLQFLSIERRIENDALHQRKICAKYLGSQSPLLPVKPNMNVNNFYVDKYKKLGWCVNPKVS